MKRVLLSILIILTLLLVACGSSSTDGGGSAPSGTGGTGVIFVNAVDLYSEFVVDEIAADAKYEGRTLEVTGVVDILDVNIGGTLSYVVLRGGTVWEVWGIKFLYDSNDEPQLAELKREEEVIIRGTYDGYPPPGRFVMMRNSTLVD